MAENDQYDEYQFSDYETVDNDSFGEETGLEAEESRAGEPQRKNIFRNVLIVLVLIVLFILGYRFIASYWAPQDQTAGIPVGIPPLTPVAQQPEEPQPQAPSSVAPVQPPASAVSVSPPAPAPEDTQVSQKLSALEMGQQSVRSQVNSVGNQLSGLTSNVNELTAKIASLNQTIADLSAKVEQQSHDIVLLRERAKPKPVKRIVIKSRASRPTYYIQAVIPGRAWLIATNGSTITVREGTQLAGYGLVTLIDPNQGRVVTSSGQVIRFSQHDS